MANWISVNDELPDNHKGVLCIGLSKVTDEYLAPVVASLQNDGKFVVGYQFEGDRAIGFYVETYVTHWMPLPPPPVVES